MKECFQSDGDSRSEPYLVTSETYLGTRMDEKALTFHTQLHDWNEAQSLVSKHTQMLMASRQQDAFLPVKKLAHIECWTCQVNRYYGPPKNARPKSGSFMKIDVTKYNMKVDKNEETRSKSAIYPHRTRTTSAVSRATTTRSRFFGNDYHTVKSNLAESQMFYSAQRRYLQSATTRKSTKSAKTDDLKTTEMAASELVTNSKFDNETDTITIIDHNNDSKASDIESLETEVMQPYIVARSYSNRELNVISIDDCKITCRYRPQLIKENRQFFDEESDSQETPEKCDKAKGKLSHNKHTVKKDSSNKGSEGMNGFEADDEISSESVNTIDNALNGMDIQDEVVDTNNNTRVDSCSRNANCSLPPDNQHENKSRKRTSIRRSSDNSHKATSLASSSAENSKESQSHSNSSPCENGYGDLEHSLRPRVNFSSRGSSKASYGRITALSAREPGSRSKKDATKRVTRSARINHAINDVVQNRRVMNAEKDFDTRTAVYGRTIVEVSEGSERFKKLHACLRKKIDDYVDTHSAVNTKDYYERSRRNSAMNSVK